MLDCFVDRDFQRRPHWTRQEVAAAHRAILQAKHIFGPTAWAPVANNVIVVLTLGVYAIMPGEISLNPVRMGDAKLLTLGIGVTLGIAVQAFILLPALRRIGFRFRWNWGLDARLREFGGLAMWLLTYTMISQLGMIFTTRVLTAGATGGMSIYSNAWLLFQLPYGVIGVSLLTAIMPRLSRAAADGDTHKLIGDLSLGSRLCTVMLVPISAMLTICGPAIGIALFAFERHYDPTYPHIRFFTKRSLSDLVERAGLKIESIGACGSNLGIRDWLVKTNILIAARRP